MLKRVSISSDLLNKEMKINVFLPDGYSEKVKLPVLYIIHGYTNNNEGFMPGIGLEIVAQKMISEGKISPLIIVAPAIDNSFGLNSSRIPFVVGDDPVEAMYSGMYADYLSKEVIPFIDKNYSTIKYKSGRFIGGASMGGFAALHLAFTNTDLFSKVGGHMPAVLIDTSFKDFLSWVYPNQKIRNLRDPIKLANTNDLSEMDVYLDCGDNDSFNFYEGSELLYKELKDRGVNAQYHLKKGNHDDEYLKGNLEEYLNYYVGV